MATPLLCIVDPSLRDFVGHHFEYDAAVAEGARAAGRSVVCLAHRELEIDVDPGVEVRRAFAFDIWEGMRRVEGASHEQKLRIVNKAFAEDLIREAATLGLDRDSLVFGHMVTSAQLLGWGEFVRRFGRTGAQTVLLLRYQPSFYEDAVATEGFRLLERLAAGGARVRLASDSARLSLQLQELTSLPVEVFPIPHTHAAAAAADGSRKPGPLTVVTLGGPRDEKGFVELVAAIRTLEARAESHRFRFVLQANNPDPACAPVIARLKADLPGNVELIEAPLPTADYYALLERSDAVALPYWRSIYEARTSGVLLEALGAGKPTLCTADTWMSDQLAAGGGLEVRDRDVGDLARQLLTLADDFERLAAEARGRQPRWLDTHNPHAFHRALSEGGALPQAPPGARALILYPWGDAHRRASGASLRVGLFAQFLTERTRRVHVLEDSQYARHAVAGVDYEAYRLLEHWRGTRTGRWLTRALIALFGAKNGEELYVLLHLYPQLDRGLRRRIDQLVRGCDVVFLEYAFWAPVAAEACRRHGKPLVLTTQDVVADQIRASPVLRWLAGRIERRGMLKAGRRVTVSAADQVRFARWGVESRLIPQFVDVAAARAAPPAPRVLLNRLCGFPDGDEAAIFFFVGSRFLPNTVAAENLQAIAAAARVEHPGVDMRFVVAGGCRPAGDEGGLKALGFVDESLLALLYQHCTAVVIPLTLGTGASLKTVEAFAAGAAIVGTSVAFRGVEIAPGQDCLLEDDFSRWPALLARLAGDRPFAAALRAGASATGEGFDYRRVCAAYLPLAPALEVDPRPQPPAADARVKGALGMAAQAGAAKLPETALAILAQVRADRPGDVQAMMAEAELRLSGSPPQTNRAEMLLHQALARGADPVAVFRQLARAAELSGDPAAAQERRRQAARILASFADDPSREPLVREGLWREFNNGERLWVRDAAREIVSAPTPRRHDYHYLFALLEEELGGDMAMALRHAELGLSQGFDRFWSMRLIGAAHHRLGDYQAAFDAYAQAEPLARNPGERRLALDGMLTAGWRRLERGDRAGALSAAERVAALEPANASAAYLAAECLRHDRSRLREALGAFDRAAALGFDACWCAINQGRVLIALGDHAAGVERLCEAFPLAVDPHQVGQVRDGVADAIEAATDRQPLAVTRAMVAAGLQTDPANPRLTALAAGFRRDVEGLGERERESALRTETGRLFSQGAVAASLAYACEGERLFPRQPLFSYYRGECLQVLGRDLDQAEAAYGRALEHGIAPFWALFKRSQVRAKLGRPKLAVDDARAAVRAARTEAERKDAQHSLDQLQAPSGARAA